MKIKFLLLGLLLVLITGFSKTFARELNSSNILNICPNPSIRATCNLSNTGITSIATNTFSGYINLTTINLDNNQITSIESGDFYGLPKLTNLYLYLNQITSIEEGDFYGLSGLTTLYLSYNQIASIESGAFIRLSKLSNLQLQSNKITLIESGIFYGLSNIATLNLGSNQIAYIESGMFLSGNGFSKLTTLNLSINCYKSGTVNIPFNMSSLSSINSANCVIINSTNSSNFISALTNISYTFSNNYYRGTYPISFVAGITNKILANTVMRSLDSKIEVRYESGTIITTNGQSFTGILQEPVAFSTGNIKGLNNIDAVIKFGDSTKSIKFSQPVTVRMPILGKSSGDIVKIYYTQNLDGSWLFHTGTTVINSGSVPYVEFTTDHATYFAIGEEVGSFTINNDISTTTSQSVTLTISASGATHMRFSNDNDFTGVSWIPYSTSQSRTLSAGAGTKTVYAQFDVNGDGIADANSLDEVEYILGPNEGQISLEILSGASQCIYGTSLSLGNQNVKFDTGYTFTGDFGATAWSCTDYKAGSGWRTFTIQSSDLSNGKGNSISATGIEINHSAATISGEPKCMAGYASGSTWAVINTPYTIMERKIEGQQTCKVTIPTVNLKIGVGANQAPGTYSGTLTLTIPSF